MTYPPKEHDTESHKQKFAQDCDVNGYPASPEILDRAYALFRVWEFGRMAERCLPQSDLPFSADEHVDPDWNQGVTKNAFVMRVFEDAGVTDWHWALARARGTTQHPRYVLANAAGVVIDLGAHRPAGGGTGFFFRPNDRGLYQGVEQVPRDSVPVPALVDRLQDAIPAIFIRSLTYPELVDLVAKAFSRPLASPWASVRRAGRRPGQRRVPPTSSSTPAHTENRGVAPSSPVPVMASSPWAALLGRSGEPVNASLSAGRRRKGA